MRGSSINGERLVLLVGIGSALALSWAAIVAVGSPEAAGAVAVARIAGEVSDGLVLEWERLLRDPDGPPPAGETFTWPAGGGIEAGAVHDLGREPAPGPSTFDALFADAERLELREGRLAEALVTLREALAAQPDPARRASGRLRAIQVAVRANVPSEARDQWNAARTELAPEDAMGGISALLLCALAAGPALDPEERADVQDILIERWGDGRLALPAGSASLVGDPASGFRIEESPEVGALRERVLALADTADASDRIERASARRRVAALVQPLGGLPAPPNDGRWHFFTDGPAPFAARVDANGDARGRFVAFDALADALRTRASLPEDFHVAFGDEVAAGTPVRGTTALPGIETGFRLHHVAPERLMRAEGRRVRLLRIALVVVAVFSAAASFFIARTLRRERRLAGLKSSFIAGVSHDLRTPLASILLMAENLEHGRVADETARERYYASIRREADRLRRLVDDVLDFSRMERGPGTVGAGLLFEDVALAHFFDELGEELTERARTAGFAFAATRGPLPESASIDAEALRRAVWNLVENAFKHGGNGPVQLAVSANASELVIEVSDRGPGVPPGQREEVFRPFHQLNGGPSSTGGSGLGLAIVREVARAHGGEASVRAGADGIGAVFALTLDLSPDKARGVPS